MEGIWRASDLAEMVKKHGWLPQSGSLECLGYHCQCSLEDIKAPGDDVKLRSVEDE